MDLRSALSQTFCLANIGSWHRALRGKVTCESGTASNFLHGITSVFHSLRTVAWGNIWTARVPGFRRWLVAVTTKNGMLQLYVVLRSKSIGYSTRLAHLEGEGG